MLSVGATSEVIDADCIYVIYIYIYIYICSLEELSICAMMTMICAFKRVRLLEQGLLAVLKCI